MPRGPIFTDDWFHGLAGTTKDQRSSWRHRSPGPNRQKLQELARLNNCAFLIGPSGDPVVVRLPDLALPSEEEMRAWLAGDG